MINRTRWAIGATIALVGTTPLALAGGEGPDDRAIDIPTTAETADGPISVSEAIARGMGCNFTGDALNCYPTHGEAIAALKGSSNTILAGCAPPMTLWLGANFTGSSLTISPQGQWINLPSGYNNAVSSWQSGCAGGYLADGTGGAGTHVGLPAGGSSATLGSFDNKASSVKRCPC